MPRPRSYSISAPDKRPIYSFVVDAIEAQGCTILYTSEANLAPFLVTFETPTGERMGICCYAFLANSKVTRNRPSDEHRMQVKYGAKDGGLHELWRDPLGLFTTLFLGINPEAGFFVGVDPEMHNPTRFFISIEFKQRDVDATLRAGWHAWERDQRRGGTEPVEVLVGGTADRFLQYVRFERAAHGLDQGHRQLLAEKAEVLFHADQPGDGLVLGRPDATPPTVATPVQAPAVHALAREFALSEAEVLNVIASAPRLKMAVRGWVAEEHLTRTLAEVEGVSECSRINEEGGADVRLRYRGSRPLEIQCKNVLRARDAKGQPRVDFQKTRASKSDPCSRYYRVEEFDLVAACLHALTERWQFSYALPRELDSHRTCHGRLSNNVRVDQRWSEEASNMLAAAAR